MNRRYRIRLLVSLLVVLIVAAIPVSQTEMPREPSVASTSNQAVQVLGTLEVKGRAPKTGYSRSEFGSGWTVQNGCSTREIILARDLKNVEATEDCRVLRGVLSDPYTDQVIRFERGPISSQEVQIDHVVALSNAWQTGAQQLSETKRIEFANDPENLLAVDGRANEQKSDGDAATWLPPNKSFRCEYVTRQVAVKSKYSLWLTSAEKEAMYSVLLKC